MENERNQNSKTNTIKENKVGKSHCLIVRFTTKLQKSKQHATGEGTGEQSPETDHMNMASCFLTKVQSELNRE